MPRIYHAMGPGARLAEALGADDSLRSQMSGDIHLVSLDGKYFYRFARRPEADDYEALVKLIDDDDARPMEYGRGIVERALGEIEEIEA